MSTEKFGWVAAGIVLLVQAQAVNAAGIEVKNHCSHILNINAAVFKESDKVDIIALDSTTLYAGKSKTLEKNLHDGTKYKVQITASCPQGTPGVEIPSIKLSGSAVSSSQTVLCPPPPPSSPGAGSNVVVVFKHVEAKSKPRIIECRDA